ncbi:MAG: amidohydrolase family protein, partial [Bacillota bacterium]|nr:amidohydrolase family protein [Bacillota bacterium]
PRELLKKYGSHERIKIEVAPHAPYTCTDEALVSAKKLADELGVILHIHLSESDAEYDGSMKEYGVSPTERLFGLGILGKTTAAAHCVKMSDADLDILAKTGTGVLLNPSSNLKLGNGSARARDMHSRAINLSIGTDGASSNNNLNMMEEMHLAALLYGMTPAEILEAATLGGAKSAGYSDLGLIREGFLADIAIADLSSHNLTPHGDLIAALCYSASASDICDLMVSGEYVMRNRKILTFDEDAVKQTCREIAWKLLGEENDFRTENKSVAD